MKQRPLSSRALELLAIVDKATTWEGDVRPGFHLTRFYIPRRLDGVSGSGDSLALKALDRRRSDPAHARAQ